MLPVGFLQPPSSARWLTRKCPSNQSRSIIAAVETKHTRIVYRGYFLREGGTGHSFPWIYNAMSAVTNANCGEQKYPTLCRADNLPGLTQCMRVCQSINIPACCFTLQRRRRVTHHSASLPKSSPSTFQHLFLPCNRWSTITRSAQVVVVTTAPIKKKSTIGPTVWYAQHADELVLSFVDTILSRDTTSRLLLSCSCISLREHFLLIVCRKLRWRVGSSPVPMPKLTVCSTASQSNHDSFVN